MTCYLNVQRFPKRAAHISLAAVIFNQLARGCRKWRPTRTWRAFVIASIGLPPSTSTSTSAYQVGIL